jgi:hypothetical protein
MTAERNLINTSLYNSINFGIYFPTDTFQRTSEKSVQQLTVHYDQANLALPNKNADSSVTSNHYQQQLSATETGHITQPCGLPASLF